jgi:hypothetical protein
VGCVAAASPQPSQQGYYTIVVNVVPAVVVPPTPETYNMTATPVLAPQTTDALCTSFTLNSVGTQSATPAANTRTCWGST